MKKPPFYKSVLYALKGIFGMLQTERNFQIEVFALLVNLFLIVFLKLNAFDTALILIVCFGVLVTEMLNTAIEKICDFTQPDFDQKIGFIKDIAAGAVLLASFVSVIVGILVYYKYIF